MGLIRLCFDKARDIGAELALLNSRRCFTEALAGLVQTFAVTSQDDAHDRIFKKFKSEYETQKSFFETTDEYSSRLGWQNFVELMDFATRDLEENNYFDIDIIQAMAIQNSVEKVYNTWQRLPYAHQKIIDEEGLIFEGYEGVQCINFVMGILNSKRSKDMGLSIITHKVKQDEIIGVPVFPGFESARKQKREPK